MPLTFRPDPGTSNCPYRVYNIGNNQPVRLEEFIAAIEKCIGKQARKRYLPIQPGDVEATFADTSDLERIIGFRPATPIEQGVRRFVQWYRSYHLTA